MTIKDVVVRIVCVSAVGLCALPASAQLKLTTSTIKSESLGDKIEPVSKFNYFVGDPFQCNTDSEVVRDPRDDRYKPPTAGMMHVTGVNGSQISLPCSVWQDYPNYDLSNQPTFPPIDALDRFVYTLTTPQGMSLRRIEAPSGWTIDWRQYQTRVLIWGNSPGTANTAIFEAITNSGQSNPMEQPINPNLNACTSANLAFSLRLGDSLDARICAAGDTSGLSWHYVADNPSNRLPVGFSLNLPRPIVLGGPTLCVQAKNSPYSGCSGRVSGTVGAGARTSSGQLQLRDAQGQVVASKVFRLDIAPHALPSPAWRRDGTRIWQSLVTFDATKHEPVSIALPMLAGGDGSVDVDWVVGHVFPNGVGRPLQPRRRGANWYLEGVIPSALQSDVPHLVRLEVSSPGSFNNSELRFHVRPHAQPISEVSVLAQNTLLRNTELPGDVRDMICDGAQLGLAAAQVGLGVLTGGAVPFTPVLNLLFGCPVAQLLAETGYDTFGVQNTASDNSLRAGLVSSMILNNNTRRARLNRGLAYDIALLQEVFDPTSRAIFSASLGASYSLHDGPASANTLTGSGLLTAVRSLPVLAQDSQIYTSTEGHDSLASKGFLATQIQLGDDPNAYIWVINTHTQAGGANTAQTRMNQFAQIETWIGIHTDPDNPVLIVGDLNVRELSVPHLGSTFEALVAALGLDRNLDEYEDMMFTLGDPIDLYREQHPIIDSDPGNGNLTSDARRNPYAMAWFGNELPKRLDYFLLYQGEEYKLLSDDIVMVDDNFPGLTPPNPTPLQTIAGTANSVSINGAACAADQANTDGSAFGLDSGGNALMCGYLSDHYGIRADLFLVRD